VGAWTFYDQLVKVEKGWVEQEFVLLIIAALPSEAGLPNEYISYRIVSKLAMLSILCIKDTHTEINFYHGSIAYK